VSYTLGDITTKVQQRVRDTGYSSTEIKNYINDTINDVFNEYRLPFMQTSEDYTLAVGVADLTNSVGLPTNYVQALDLTLTSGGMQSVLEYTDASQLNALYPDPSDTGLYPSSVPSKWYFYAETINVFPAASTAITATLRYYKKPTEITSDAAIPELPSEFQELLVVGAAYRVLQVKDNYDQAGILENKYNEILQKLVVKYSVPQTGQPMRQRINRYALGKSNF
jgi:hypothetical protein